MYCTNCKNVMDIVKLNATLCLRKLFSRGSWVYANKHSYYISISYMTLLLNGQTLPPPSQHSIFCCFVLRALHKGIPSVTFLLWNNYADKIRWCNILLPQFKSSVKSLWISTILQSYIAFNNTDENTLLDKEHNTHHCLLNLVVNGHNTGSRGTAREKKKKRINVTIKFGTNLCFLTLAYTNAILHEASGNFYIVTSVV